ncbi:MAG: O-antigen ligase family protein [Kiritimatiellia bacterium]|jgi:O-antigen ligase|nr:O-antigen ligase family protein [Kiritimatiellia bacterium]MDP6631162.1 O-antigen ligase family protein [Kiritimatiellia bacterium]MDP6809816.1 O-antigen ligase family protein [Kiritimatiellia bacterium]MDP7025074.1 O-antigen ligase family protein [Kiritimatiellia bacterium]
MGATRTSKTQSVLQGVARWLATAAVIFSPWLFGSSEPWAYLMISGLAGCATMAWLFAVASARTPDFVRPTLSALLLLLIVVAVLQMLPLPRGVVSVLNPFSATITDSANSALSDLAAIGDTESESVNYALSLSPSATWRSVWLLVAYAGVLLVLINTCRHWQHMSSVAVAVVVSGFFMALVALVHRFSGSYNILWVHEPRHHGSIFGPFTNRNHFAAHANMLFGMALGLFLSSQHISEILSWPSWRERIAWLSSRSASRIALAAFAVVLIGGTSCATASRGGMLSLAVGLTLAAVVVTRHRSVTPSARIAVFAINGLVLVIALWLAREEVFMRLAMLATVVENPMEDLRTIATGDTLRLYLRCPLSGCGFGAFRHAYTIVQTPALSDRWLHAHNDWAQLLAEGGWLGTVTFLGALIVFVRYIVTRFVELSDRARLYVLGVCVGLCTIALHSIVDYSLHKPGNALLLCFLVAQAILAIHLRHRPQEKAVRHEHALLRSMQHDGRRTRRSWLQGTTRKRVMRGLAIAALALMSLLMVLQSRALRGELALTRFFYLERQAEKTDDVALLEAVVTRALDEGELVRELAPHNADGLADVTAAMLAWTLDTRLPRELRTRVATRAIESAMVSVKGAPSDYLPWLTLARTYFTLGMWDHAEIVLKQARHLVRHRDQVRMFAAPADE